MAPFSLVLENKLNGTTSVNAAGLASCLKRGMYLGSEWAGQEFCVTASGEVPLGLILWDCCERTIQEEEEEVGVGYKKPRERWMGAEGEHQVLVTSEGRGAVVQDLSVRKCVHIPWEIPFPSPQSCSAEPCSVTWVLDQPHRPRITGTSLDLWLNHD